MAPRALEIYLGGKQDGRKPGSRASTKLFQVIGSNKPLAAIRERL
jgi:hypothetical protein